MNYDILWQNGSFCRISRKSYQRQGKSFYEARYHYIFHTVETLKTSLDENDSEIFEERASDVVYPLGQFHGHLKGQWRRGISQSQLLACHWLQKYELWQVSYQAKHLFQSKYSVVDVLISNFG